MKTQKIKSITEAFSMQPAHFYVTEKVDNKYPENYKFYVKRIEEEFKQLRDGDIITYYVGYDWNEDIMFKYIAKTVNVTYYYPEEQ